MTDAELPPCCLCGNKPRVLTSGRARHKYRQGCRLGGEIFEQAEWIKLHAPAQVLREIDLICDGFINDTGYHDYYRDLAGRIKELIQKAQQLSGSGNGN